MTLPLNLSDTRTWLPLEGLAPGFDTGKASHSDDLEGTTISVVQDGYAQVLHFSHGSVAVSMRHDIDSDAASTEIATSEVVEVADDLYYVQLSFAERPTESLSLFLDLRSGYALSVRSTLADARPGWTAVSQSFTLGQIEAIEAAGEPPAPTDELIGRRVLWVYSNEHAYEHVYLSRHWYTWHCLAGPEHGLADTDENTVWRIRPGIYVFAWREKVIPCGSVTIADHRDASALRAHGVLFGAGGDDQPGMSTQFTFGAHGRLLSATLHPSEFDPRRQIVR